MPPLSTLTIRPTVERLRDLERNNARILYWFRWHLAADVVVVATILIAIEIGYVAAGVLVVGYIWGVLSNHWSRRNG